MRPLCHDSPPVLDPCLLGGRMLAAGRRVKNGPIGLDQPRNPFQRELRIVDQKEFLHQSEAVRGIAERTRLGS